MRVEIPIDSGALIDDELKRNLLLKNISKRFNLREKLLESELSKQMKQVQRFEKSGARNIQQRKAEATSSVLIDSAAEISPALYNLEKEILRLLFEADNSTSEIIFTYLQPEDFGVQINRELFEIVKDEFENEENFTTSGLMNLIKDEKKEAYIRELTFDKYTVSSSWEDRFPSITTEMTMLKYAKDAVMKFVIERIENQIKSNRREIELTDDERKLLDLMKINNELEREKKRIREALGN